MFRTLKQRISLGLYIFLLLSIPVGAYLASESQNPNAAAKAPNRTITNVEPSPTTTDLDSLLNEISSPLPSSNEPTPANSFGPIMDFILYLEGRPLAKQAAKVFIGIAEGVVSINPKYLLQFTIDLPDDGQYPNVSLAGLTAGNSYTAYLKGPAQIATASAFTMSAFTTHLNDGKPLIGLSGDLNDDNTINETDLSIAKKGNLNADFNLDGKVNNFDIAFILKNMDKTGNSGVWVSKPPKP